MNVGSLFAGIGGFDLGFERAGMSISWQVEQDPYCRAVLARHFPAARRYGRVEEVGARNLAPVELICGGFPCQDLSPAGRGAGLDGARSGLWSEFARIVRELRPSYVVVENVPALLTGKGKRWARAPIGRVLGDLAEVGYDAEWACLSAREFGAPHLRKRVWIVAYPARDAEAGSAPQSRSERQRVRTGRPTRGAGAHPDTDARGLPLVPELDGAPQARRQAPPRGRHPDRLRDALPDADGDGRPQGLCLAAGSGEPPGQADPLGGRPVAAVADAERRGWQGRPDQSRRGDPERAPSHRLEGAALPQGGGAARRPGGQLPASEGWSAEPDVGRVADGVPARVDRLAALGNALVPQIAEWIGRRILAYEQSPEAPPPARETVS